MQHLTSIEIARRAVRSAVCPICPDRPAGSETADATTARVCEPECTIFLNLPKLIDLAGRYDEDVTLTRYERAMREVVCQQCATSPTAGDFCSDRTVAACPLSRHAGDVITSLERVRHAVDQASTA